MTLPALEPLDEARLPEFCRFLVENLSPGQSADVWAQAFLQRWGVVPPNHGFVIRDQGRIVGGIGAIYAEREIRGQPERFCNITSWCVLERYRAQSMRLAMAVVSQRGFHFSDLTPTEVVSKTLQFLKFKPMNERQAVWPNVPWPVGAWAGVRVVTDPDRMLRVLPAADARAYSDHRQFPWLRHAAIGRQGMYCHVVWRPDTLKGVRGARVLACADANLFLRYRLALGAYLLARGRLYTRIESRLLPRLPRGSNELTGFRQKVFRSDTLGEADISNLYSEIVALNL